MSDRKPTSVVPWITGSTLALLAAYVAEYYVNVMRRSEMVIWRLAHHAGVVTDVKPEYTAQRLNGFSLRRIGWTAGSVRNVWEPKP